MKSLTLPVDGPITGRAYIRGGKLFFKQRLRFARIYFLVPTLGTVVLLTLSVVYLGMKTNLRRTEIIY